MPRKAKEIEEVKNENISIKTNTKSSPKSTTRTSKKSDTKTTNKSTKKSEEKAVAKSTKKPTTKVSTKLTKKSEENTVAKSARKSDAKTSTKSTKKSDTKTVAKSAKKSDAKATSKTATKATKKSETNSTKKSTTKKKKTEIGASTLEYYDLPQRYNQTVVKVLAQTPKTLFIYWEISDDDLEKYRKQYGDNFFNVTKPVLIIHNDTLNYSFEVDINDFANSWYLHINDSKSNYRIELGRRPINNDSNINSDYIYISSSNEIESPNDHILFNNSQKMVYFRNIKNNQTIEKPITSLSFMRNMGKIYDIYDLYNEFYKGEDVLEDLSNPSSHTSSQFK